MKGVGNPCTREPLYGMNNPVHGVYLCSDLLVLQTMQIVQTRGSVRHNTTLRFNPQLCRQGALDREQYVLQDCMVLDRIGQLLGESWRVKREGRRKEWRGKGGGRNGERGGEVRYIGQQEIMSHHTMQ